MGFAAHLYHRSQTGRRADARLRLSLPGELITLDGQGHAVVENLSRTGARIATRMILRPKSSCVLRWPEAETFCTVRWSAGGRCGLVFDSPLSKDELMRARWLDANLDQVERDHWQRWAREFVNGRAGSSQ